MSFQIACKADKLLDDCTSQEVVRTLPGHEQVFKDNDDLRRFADELAKVNTNRRAVGLTNMGMMHIARIPLGVWAVMLQQDPNIMKDKAKIYRFLKRNPGYKIGSYTNIG